MLFTFLACFEGLKMWLEFLAYILKMKKMKKEN